MLKSAEEMAKKFLYHTIQNPAVLVDLLHAYGAQVRKDDAHIVEQGLNKSRLALAERIRKKELP